MKNWKYICSGFIFLSYFLSLLILFQQHHSVHDNIIWSAVILNQLSDKTEKNNHLNRGWSLSWSALFKKISWSFANWKRTYFLGNRYQGSRNDSQGTGIEGRRIGCQESVKSLRQEVIWDSSPLELTECSDIRVSLKDLRIHALTLESCTYIIFRECSLTSPCLQKNWWFHNDRSLNIHPRSFICNPWSAIVLF